MPAVKTKVMSSTNQLVDVVWYYEFCRNLPECSPCSNEIKCSKYT